MSIKKRIILIVILIMILIILSIIAFSIFRKEPQIDRANVEFVFKDLDALEKEIEVNTKEKYEPEKVTVTVDGKDMSNLIKVDDSDLDLTRLGTYIIKYYIIYQNQKYEKEQIIKIVDTTAPIITLKGKSITILINEKYEDPGYTVEDNYDKNLSDKVEVINKVDNTKAGTYKITYKVADSSNNQTEVTREVIVKKPNVIVSVPKKEVKVDAPKIVETNYRNTIKKNKFTSSNIYLEGYVDSKEEPTKIKFVGDNTYEFEVNMNGNNYTTSINIDNIENGNYKLYINDETILNKMNIIERLSRAKVGNKLVTFNYNKDDEVSVEIANHEYLYDILINPGHGGYDTGAVNEYVEEKEMNLKVSLYEKCRYEAHGLRVYMTRTTDVYGANFGPNSLIDLHKIGYEMGYYGAVSKIVYSNHHNSIGNNYFSGYEILMAGALTKDELKEELAIANKWNSIFDLTENHTRFYARDYVTESIHSKLNGETYTFKDNYAINRIPYQTANVKSIIFEDSYISNKNEFKWYWLNSHWYDVSEAKIEVYVNSLGINYNPDNTSCL